MLDALIRITDRHIVAIVYFFFGLLNAQSWPYLAGFVAIGLMIDALAPRFLSSATADKERADYTDLAYNAGWRWLSPLAVVDLALDCGVAFGATPVPAAST